MVFGGSFFWEEEHRTVSQNTVDVFRTGNLDQLNIVNASLLCIYLRRNTDEEVSYTAECVGGKIQRLGGY